MRIGVFSDVHANMEALAAVRTALVAESPDMIVCLGDTVGYGGSPAECCRAVRALASVTVVGNHDAAVASRMNYSYYYESARRILDEHARLIGRDHQEWLGSLPYTYDMPEHHMLLSHGSPLRPDAFDYIFEVEHAQRLLEIEEKLPVVTFIGHSHLYRCYVLERGDAYEVTSARVKLSRDAPRHVISVGSVGQPRDLDNRASFVIYDTDAMEVVLTRVEYDIEAASEKILGMRGDPNFSERLLLGW